MIQIDYSPHRLNVTSESTLTVDVRYYFMPLYGPQEWFPFEPVTQVSSPDIESRS